MTSTTRVMIDFRPPILTVPSNFSDAADNLSGNHQSGPDDIGHIHIALEG